MKEKDQNEIFGKHADSEAR